jgi:type IV secretion system protein VirB6
MATPSSFHFFSALINELNGLLSTYVTGTATNMITAITPVTTTLLTIYVILWGWSMMRGTISEPVTDGVGRIIRLAVITGIALNIGRYNAFLGDFLWQTPDALASAISSGTSTPNITFLDQLMSQMYDLGSAYYQFAHANSTMGIPSIGLLLTAWAVWAVGLLATCYGAFLLALSKMGLAILLGVGPLFVLASMFEAFKRFFEAWIGHALNFVFLAVLSGAAIKLIMSIVQHFLNDNTANLASPSIDQAIAAIGLTFIGFLVLCQVPSIASALGGGVAISTLGAVRALGSRASRGARATGVASLAVAGATTRGIGRTAQATSQAAHAAVRAVWNSKRAGGKNNISQG